MAPADGGASAAARQLRMPGPIAVLRQSTSINIRHATTRDRSGDRRRSGAIPAEFPAPGRRLRPARGDPRALGSRGRHRPASTAASRAFRPGPAGRADRRSWPLAMVTLISVLIRASARRSSQSVRKAISRCGLLRADRASAVSSSPLPRAASSASGRIWPAAGSSQTARIRGMAGCHSPANTTLRCSRYLVCEEPRSRRLVSHNSVKSGGQALSRSQ